MLLCMRTTIDMNNELFRSVKRRSAQDGVPMKDLVETALRLYLERRRPSRTRFKLQWHTERGRLQPGVIVEDRGILFDAMDGVR